MTGCVPAPTGPSWRRRWRTTVRPIAWPWLATIPTCPTPLADLSGAASIRLRKGAMACLEFMGEPDAGSGRLRWLLDPDLYRDDPQHG